VGRHFAIAGSVYRAMAFLIGRVGGSMAARYYITTPIYYPNAEPHLGHCYTTLAADTVARYHRLRGDTTFFLTGTDEHGVKMVKTAEQLKTEPGKLADQVVQTFIDAWKELDITNDDFIRTTSERHKTSVAHIVRQLVANGDIYLGSYQGWYDEGQEEFVTETEAKAAEFKSVISGRPLTRYSEPTYFFKLRKYAARVLDHIENNPEFLRPDSRRNEVVSKLKAGVEDLSISRATLKWGIPMPNDPDHVLYVWIDALSNYITALGYGSSDDARFRQFWPVDVHLIGKEILWFHAVYWPAMLMSLGLELPRHLFAHGWWTADGKKMSKTMGNFIGLDKLRAVIAEHGRDALRYYLLRAAPFGSDLNWSDLDFAKSYSELGNVVGNLLNRVLKMVGKYRDGKLPAIAEAHRHEYPHLLEQRRGLEKELNGFYLRMELQQCAVWPLEMARTGNGFIEQTQPFSLAKDPAQSGRLDTVLNLAAQHIYCVLVALLPILPEKATEGLRQLGVDVAGRTIGELLGTELPAGHQILEGIPLFPRVEAK
jgi:methionyl-tRNA synthetase